MNVSRSGGDTANPRNTTANNTLVQELVLAGPLAIESLAPEPGGPVVRVEIYLYNEKLRTIRFRCGLVAEGCAQ
jgi:hypothetical protein